MRLLILLTNMKVTHAMLINSSDGHAYEGVEGVELWFVASQTPRKHLFPHCETLFS